MSIKIGLLAEASVTDVTAKRSLLVVDISHVTLQIGGDGEAAFAILAFVRLLTGVSSEMAC